MNYTTLTSQIIAYANRANSTEFKIAVPYFIDNGQQKIWKELRTLGFQKTVQGNAQVGVAYIPKPQDWQETISIIYGTPDSPFTNSVVLLPRSYEFCVNYWPNPDIANSNNPPLFYADYYQQNIEPYNRHLISPTPDKTYSYQLIHTTRPDLISTEKQNNVLTDHYPDLLFYACFLEALIFLKDDQRMPIYSKLYQETLDSANKLTQDRYIDRTIKRDVG
jgi:hypothetical protein